MYLINTVLFDAEWAEIYEKNDIRNREFTKRYPYSSVCLRDNRQRNKFTSVYRVVFIDTVILILFSPNRRDFPVTGIHFNILIEGKEFLETAKQACGIAAGEIYSAVAVRKKSVA